MPTNVKLVPVGNPPTNFGPAWDESGVLQGNWSKFFSSLSRFIQMLQISTGLPIHANNAAALAGGLVVGQFYRTGADPDFVCTVH